MIITKAIFIFIYMESSKTEIGLSKAWMFYWEDKSLTIYDTAAKKKTTYAISESISDVASSVICKGSIYFLGDSNYHGDFFEFNLVSNKLIAKNKMPSPRYGHGIYAFQNEIYCIGGNVYEDELTKTCKKYSIGEKNGVICLILELYDSILLYSSLVTMLMLYAEYQRDTSV